MGKVVGDVGRPSISLGTFIEEGNSSAAPTPTGHGACPGGLPILGSGHHLLDAAGSLQAVTDHVDNSVRPGATDRSMRHLMQAMQFIPSQPPYRRTIAKRVPSEAQTLAPLSAFSNHRLVTLPQGGPRRYNRPER